MTELLKIYKDLFNDNEKWKYYSRLDYNPFNSTDESRKFIAEFIELAGKGEKNPLVDNIEKLKENRIRHIISIFFLGIYIYHESKFLKSLMDKTILRFKKQNPHSKIEFSFIWFLICLFHDLGYVIEDKKHPENFESYIKGKVKYFLNKSVGVPPVYKKTFKDYFDYRLKSKDKNINKPDHGIIGGILLFNKLNDILKKKQKNNNSKGLSWNKKLINIYRFTSWIILSHNIFFIRKGNSVSVEKEYRKYNLHDLILDKTEKSKIDLEKYPFLYFFLLVDSIDPIKTFDKYENLNDLKIECVDNKILINVDNDILQEKYFNKVEALKDWLIPDIKIDKNRITIIMR